MTADTGPLALYLYRQLADLQRESDRLRIAAGARMAFEDVVARHNEIGWKEGVDPREAEAIREEAAEYLSGRRPVPPQAELAEELRKVEATGCVFCSIAAGIAPATVVRDWGDVLAIRPRSGGVNEGHLLVIPRTHVEDAGTDKRVSGRVMECASELMAEEPSANIVTSKGAPATQTVYHLHIHVVPRVVGDGLPLPWTPQQTAAAARQTEGEK
ncbi:HIT family protein [Streptomyces sp. PTD5-9]|uniref:HIT family protein n=1 Tax=Streptomyces sp. PTD5-9 TaxID=3120150 RepID=UPI003008C7E7